MDFAPDELEPLPYEGIVSDNSLDALRQEHQVGRFLSIFEQRLAWRSDLSTHGQPTRQIRDLDRARSYRESQMGVLPR